MTRHAVGTREQWRAARLELLEREKQLTRLSDEIARERLALPWVPLAREYGFETDAGPRTLAQLFDSRSQLLVLHLMLGPEWEEPCPGCAFAADQLDGALPHLAAKDVTLVAVSRGPLAVLNAHRQRTGWQMPWVSSLGSDFNFDFGVSFTPEQQARGAEYNYRWEPSWHEEAHGLSAFALQDGVVHHTYSAYHRGTEALAPVWALLDRAPRGRDEGGEPGAWIRHRDRYDELADGSADDAAEPDARAALRRSA